MCNFCLNVPLALLSCNDCWGVDVVGNQFAWIIFFAKRFSFLFGVPWFAYACAHVCAIVVTVTLQSDFSWSSVSAFISSFVTLRFHNFSLGSGVGRSRDAFGGIYVVGRGLSLAG